MPQNALKCIQWEYRSVEYQKQREIVDYAILG